ncbi:hypothetical protein TKK_0000277 [Trichogramma kaykai]|uniref:Uncharacterized protein n=1 Tax=Trichogramma kaykai TaxID=54128 RepID=A0ABD2W7Q0_9HYME
MRSYELPERIPQEAFIYGTRVFSEAYLQLLEITHDDNELNCNLQAFHAGHVDAVDDLIDPKILPDVALKPAIEIAANRNLPIVNAADAKIVQEIADIKARALPKILAVVLVERPLEAD